MKDLPVQINEKMSIFDNASVEKPNQAPGQRGARHAGHRG